MNVKKLNHWFMLAANVGVIGGILFLGFEIRQNTSQMRTEASFSITEMVNAMNADVYRDPDLTDLLMRGNLNFHSLTPNEQSRYGSFQFARINLADYILLLEEEGLTDLQFPYVQFTVNDMRCNPGTRDWLKSVEAIWLGSEELWGMLTAPNK